jgi:cobalt-zinc-cadmium resistance protein CzcA
MHESLDEIPGVRFNFSQPIKDSVEEAVSGVRGKVVLKIFGTDLDAMRATLKQARAALVDLPGVTELDLYRDVSSPQLRIRLDRTALARAGIPVEDGARTLETALAGRVVTQYWEGERPVPVRLLLPRPARDDLDQVASVAVASPSGASVPVRQVARIEVGNGVACIVREGNIRFLALKFNVKGRDMGSVVNEAIATVNARVKPPDGHTSCGAASSRTRSAP